MRLPMRLDGHLSFAGTSPPVTGHPPGEWLGVRQVVGLLLAIALLAASDLHGVDSPTARSVLTLVVVVVLVPSTFAWWRSRAGVVVFAAFIALNVPNLLSPLRSIRSALFLLAAVLSVVLVVHVARLVGSGWLRRFITGYVTVLVVGALVGVTGGAVAKGSFSLSELRVDTSAIAIWKALVIISPCPTRWAPARLAFLVLKIVLVFLMVVVDRPKLGVLLALACALAVGATVVALHRIASRRNVMLMCLAALPILGFIAVVVGSFLTIAFARGSDFSGRAILWRTAVAEMERTRSLLGVGFRNALSSPEAVNALSPRFDRALDSWGNAVHNVFLQLLVELGVLGVAVMAIVLTVAVAGLLRIRSVALQASLSIDLLFVIGLCLVEPVLEPNRIVFVLLVLTILRIYQHSVDEVPTRPPVPAG